MPSVIICEDEPIQTTLLVKLVQQWADQCALPVQILSYPNAESFLFSYEDSVYTFFIYKLFLYISFGLHLFYISLRFVAKGAFFKGVFFKGAFFIEG